MSYKAMSVDARSKSSSTFESLGRGVPGMELAADPGLDPEELMRIRLPSLSNLGGTVGSEDHDLFMLDGRCVGD